MKQLFLVMIYPLLILIFATVGVNTRRACPFAIDKDAMLNNKHLDTFLHLLKSDSFVVRNNKKYIPRFIKKELKCLGHGFRIANPGKHYNSGDFISTNLPSRQLVFVARSKNVFVMQYKKGGKATSNNLVFILHNGDQIVELWKGFFPFVAELTSVQELSLYIDFMQKEKIKFNNDNMYF